MTSIDGYGVSTAENCPEPEYDNGCGKGKTKGKQ
jgi:hypothetical protein